MFPSRFAPFTLILSGVIASVNCNAESNVIQDLMIE
jgi:hypothetical protein